jgi:hypothetical protein
VTKDIIRTLPGVRRLRKQGPEVARAVLTLLQQPKTFEDEKWVAIGLDILEAYPSEEVKIGLAKPISERRFRGINSMLAAETFLKALGLEAERKDAIKIARREAKKIVASKSPKTNVQGKQPAQVSGKADRKKPATLRR